MINFAENLSKLSAVRAGIVSDEIASILDMPAETEADISAIDAAAEGVRMKYDMLDHNEKELVRDYDKLDEKITESETVLAQSVLKDVKIWTEQEYSHLELYINFTNPNEKTIKYIRFGVMFQNSVGDTWNITEAIYTTVKIPNLMKQAKGEQETAATGDTFQTKWIFTMLPLSGLTRRWIITTVSYTIQEIIRRFFLTMTAITTHFFRTVKDMERV